MCLILIFLKADTLLILHKSISLDFKEWQILPDNICVLYSLKSTHSECEYN